MRHVDLLNSCTIGAIQMHVSSHCHQHGTALDEQNPVPDGMDETPHFYRDLTNLKLTVDNICFAKRQPVLGDSTKNLKAFCRHIGKWAIRGSLNQGRNAAHPFPKSKGQWTGK